MSDNDTGPYFKRILCKAVSSTWDAVFANRPITIILGVIGACLAIYLHRRYGGQSSEQMNDALVSIAFGLIAYGVMFAVVFLAHFFYLIPKRMVHDAIAGRDAATFQLDRFAELHPVALAMDDLQAVYDEGERLLGAYYVEDSIKPTIIDLNNFQARIRTSARSKAWGGLITLNDLKRLEDTQPDENFLRLKCRFQDAGYLARLSESDLAIFDRLLLRVERVKELVSKIEQRENEQRGEESILDALDELKALRDEGDVMLNTFHTKGVSGRKPTKSAVEGYISRVEKAARRNVLRVSPNEWSEFQKEWPKQDAYEHVVSLAKRGCFSSNESEVFERLWDRVERLKQLIYRIEQREHRQNFTQP